MKIYNVIAPLISNFLKKIMPSNLIVPILAGRIKGKKWVIGSSNLECILGSYEHSKNILFQNNVSNGDIVYDIGAHVGFYTLLASKLVGETGKVISFEPLPKNFKYIEKHAQINKINNVMLKNAAVSDFTGFSCFKEVESTFMGYLDEKGELLVETLSIDDFIKDYPELKPCCLKIDVEGAEFLVLKGAKETLEKYKPKIFLATHNDAVHEKCVNMLQNLDYKMDNINNQKNELFFYK